MSARDLFHESVRNALEKEDWIITNDPLEIQFEEVKLKIDLGAERLIAAEKAGEKIAVEIKSFATNSPVSDFYTALGQFLNYQIALEEKEPERLLDFSRKEIMEPIYGGRSKHLGYLDV